MTADIETCSYLPSARLHFRQHDGCDPRAGNLCGSPATHEITVLRDGVRVPWGRYCASHAASFMRWFRRDAGLIDCKAECSRIPTEGR